MTQTTSKTLFVKLVQPYLLILSPRPRELLTGAISRLLIPALLAANPPAVFTLGTRCDILIEILASSEMEMWVLNAFLSLSSEKSL